MKLLRKLRALFRRSKLDAEMSEEMRLHLERRAEENVAAGMSPEEARYAALRKFGGVEQSKEFAREQRGWRWLDETLQDVRYAARQLRRAPGFTAVAVLSVALGIGATTAIFSVVNEVFLKPLPVPHADELVRFAWAGSIEKINGSFSDALKDAHGGYVGTNFTLFTFRRFQENNRTLQNLFVFDTVGGHTAVIDGQAESVGNADYVAGGYFEGLGVGAQQGRVLTAEDDRVEAPPVVVISHAWWMKRFGGEPSVLGKTILVNMTPVTIVGVTPPEFRGAKSRGDAPPLFVPLALLERLTPGAAGPVTTPGFRWVFGVMGRLKPGTTLDQARANFETVFQQSVIDGSFTAGSDKLRLEDVHTGFPQLVLEPGSNGSELLRLEAAQQLNVLTGLMGLLLLIACTNVANLLLARGAARRKEIAVRLALGASRFRLVRQFLVESLMLAGGGGVLGMIFAAWGADLLAAMFRLGGVVRVEADWRVLGFALVASTITGIVFGLAPALRATRIDLTAEFQGGSRTIGARPALRLGKILMIVQVALSFVVLATAGLFTLTLRNLRAADIGFRHDHLLLFRLSAGPAGYKGERIAPLFERVAAEIRALPGVEAVTFSSRPVVSGAGDFNSVRVAGAAVVPGDRPLSAALNEVEPGFFAAYDLPAVLGRTVESRDEARATKVVVVNQAFAKAYFPGENPVGRRVEFASAEVEIVGVVRDIKYANARDTAPPTIYSPFAQRPSGYVSFAVRATERPQALAAAIRGIVHEIEPNLPVTDVRTQDEQMERLFREERMFANLSIAFGGLALLLVCVGLYGLMSYAVQRRTGEIGVRMALGALPGQMLAMILRESCGLVSAGVVVGIAGAYGATRLIASMLYGLSPIDPLAYGGVALLLVMVAGLACLLPARRAAKVDPMVALRAE